MNSASFYVLVLIALGICFGMAWSADISVVGGDANLTISSATAGQEPNSVTDETCQLQWLTLGDPTQKITIQTNLASPNFTLTAEAVSVSAGDGTAAGVVTLSTTAQDFVVSIPPNVFPPGFCTLRYTASATAADGTGSDIHTVTFTIADQ